MPPDPTPPPSPGALTIKGTLLRRNLWPPAVSLIAVLAGLWLLRTGFHGAGTGPIYGCLFVWFGGIFGFASLFRNSFPRSRPVQLRVTPEALQIDQEEPIPADEIAEAKTLTGELGLPELIVTRRDGSKRWLRLRPVEVTAVLRELGIAAGERRASFPLQLPFRTRWLASVFFLAGCFAWQAMHQKHGLAHDPSVFPLLVFYTFVPATFLAWFAGIFLRGSAIVGADGFTLRWARFSRFFSFRDVTGITSVAPWTNRYSIDLVVTLRSGRRMRLSARDAPNSDAERGAEARALRLHLTQALDRSRAAHDPTLDLDALVLHGPRSPVEWLASLDSLLHGGETRYRVAAPTAERLTDIVRDISAPPDARIGAATALLRRGDGEGRTAVRVAMEACADPDLRDTLLALEIAQDDAAFTEALRKSHTARR